MCNHCVSVNLDATEKGSDDKQARKIREGIYRMTEQIDEIEYLYRIRRLCYWLLYKNVYGGFICPPSSCSCCSSLGYFIIVPTTNNAAIIAVHKFPDLTLSAYFSSAKK